MRASCGSASSRAQSLLWMLCEMAQSEALAFKADRLRGRVASRAYDSRLTQSWHSGSQRHRIVGPGSWPASRSFATLDGDSEEDSSYSRAFGGIERRPKPTLPSAVQRAELSSFAESYQHLHAARPHVVAFVNSRSGGQTGGLLMRTLNESIGAIDTDSAFTGEVCDLSRPDEPDATLDAIAEGLEDGISEQRVLICGGDGTVTWILTAMEQCRLLEGKLHRLPVAIVPLGTGNDLARSLGWGKSLRAVSDILEYLKWMAAATPVTLDQWRLVLRPHELLPTDHKLLMPGSHPQRVADVAAAQHLSEELDRALDDEEASDVRDGVGELQEDILVGFWQNYYSFGMDAKVAAHVDAVRNGTECGRRCFRWGGGKLCYLWQGLCHMSCSSVLTPSLSHMRIERCRPAAECHPATSSSAAVAWPEAGSARDGADSSFCKTEFVDFLDSLKRGLIQGRRRGRLRQLMLVNINSYGAGLDVLPDEDVAEARPSPDDGILEMLAVRNALTAACIFSRIARPAYLTSTGRAAFRLRTGQYMQMDGEPWLLNSGCDVLVEPHRKLTMLCAPHDAPFWRGHVCRRYWSSAEDR